MLSVRQGGIGAAAQSAHGPRAEPGSCPGLSSGVPMRAGATPVYISNTTVKAGAADGTVAWAMGEQEGAPEHESARGTAPVRTLKTEHRTDKHTS